ncbi:hypothetical protein CLV31_12034 [Algoriphagus aquaeductus]|uniref:Secreted protein n=1 Tax=Algoriphagus aquaeductus TaxID=475299 RepID=A0A326RKA6_9BACT|nr:hypothetical protein [Algoriphagus aquaeductus]PZV77566.1 hypothetical protein CLV31_12034 [Algoriphagus aquaeductus]
MIKIQKLLPALALVLGATLAMAMNIANPVPNQLFAEDPANPGQFINVTTWEPDEDYECVSTGDCLYDSPNGTVIQNGTFRILP